jgi:hypothetical protein
MRKEFMMEMAAFAALALTLGCPLARVNEAWSVGRALLTPQNPGEAVQQMTEILTGLGVEVWKCGS